MTATEDKESEWAVPLGRALLQILGERDKTRKSLAQDVKLDPSTMSRLITGQIPLTVDQLARIAKALGVTRESILRRAGYLENPADELMLDLARVSPERRVFVIAAYEAALKVETGE